MNPTLSIINLNINVLTTPIKRDYLSGQKYKTQLYIVHKKVTINVKTQIDQKYRDGEICTMQTLIKRKNRC